MQNPLSTLPMTHPAVPEGTFRRAFVKGAGSGALMMGIFSALTFAVKALNLSPFLGLGTAGFEAALIAVPGMLGMMAIGMVATGLFSAIMASQRAVDTHHSAQSFSHEVSRHITAPARAQEPVVAPIPVMMDATEDHAASATSWQSRVNTQGASQDRVAQIIADKHLTDKDRASAILAAREQLSPPEATR